MSHEDLVLHVHVLETRIAKFETGLILVLDAIRDGKEKSVASEIRELIAADLEEWE